MVAYERRHIKFKIFVSLFSTFGKQLLNNLRFKFRFFCQNHVRRDRITFAECYWGLRPKPPLGLHPGPRWRLPLLDPLLNGVWGGAPAGAKGGGP